MDKSAKIYVAGHRGMVGSAILRKLKSAGYSNIVTRTHAELDLIRQDQVEAFFRLEKPDFVFLAAAKVGGIWGNTQYPAQFIYRNLAIQTNVIQASFENRVEKLLFLGSACIYPKMCPQPIREEYLLSDYLEPTNEPYAIAKIAGLKMCQAFNREYHTCYISVMPNNLYGPRDNFNLETSHVLPALIRKFHLAKLALSRDWNGIKREVDTYGSIPDDIKKALGLDPITGRPVNRSRIQPVTKIWGTGAPRREFLHVDDLAAACIFLMDTYEQSDIINIGWGKDLTIMELADLVAAVIGYQGDIEWDHTKPDGTPQKLLDVSRLNQLGWQAKIKLEDGIRQVYQWYVGNIG
jgi:GDP-L-fucose synthase